MRSLYTLFTLLGTLLVFGTEAIEEGSHDETSTAEQRARIERFSESEARTDTVFFRRTSSLNNRSYQVSLFEDRGLLFHVEGTSDSLFVPIDVTRFTMFVFNRYLGERDGPTAGLKVDSSSNSINFLIDHTLPFATLALLFVALSISIISTLVYRSRRNLETMRQSRNSLIVAKEEERSELASELHDGPIQLLQHVARSLSPTSNDEGSDSATLAGYVDQAIVDLRSTCNHLRPPVLHHFGLIQALRDALSELDEQFPAVSFIVDVDRWPEGLSYNTNLLFYRIALESINNALKHSNSTEILLSLVRTDSILGLTIQDDGCGFKVKGGYHSLVRSGHSGLSSMAQRADAAGAKFTVVSSLGNGTTITLTQPLSRIKTIEPHSS